MSAPLPCDGTGRLVLAALDDATLPGLGLHDATIAEWCGVDRSLVGHWRSGARSMTLWALRRVLRRVSVAAAVAALRELVPAGVSVEARTELGVSDLHLAAATASVAAAQLSQAIAESRAPFSPGGRSVTPEERAAILALLDHLDEHSRAIRAQLAHPGVRP